MDYRERISLLMKLRDVIRSNEKNIYKALESDLGKSAFEAYESEIGLVLNELNYTIKYLSSWMKYKTVPTPFSHMPATSMVYREAYGNVLIIAPWNYPFQLALIPLINAWAAGNQVVLNVSAISGNSAKLLYEMLTSNFHTSRVRVIVGDKSVMMDLLNKKFDFIFFTGKYQEGKLVMHKAAEQMTPVSLQLGGKTACVVDESANIKEAARRIVRGKFLNCGQSVTAPEYILADEKVYDDLVKYMTAAITEYYGEDPLQSPDYGSIINLEEFFRLLDLLECQEVLTGGTYDTGSVKIAPTIVKETSLCSAMMREEIFGPILPVIVYRTWQEAVDLLGRFHHPPAIYLFTKKKSHEEFIKNEIIAGSVCINDVMLQYSTPFLPAGGVGNSGFGKYHGKAGFDLFSNIKSVMKRTRGFGISQGLIIPPFKDKLKLLKRFLK